MHDSDSFLILPNSHLMALPAPHNLGGTHTHIQTHTHTYTLCVGISWILHALMFLHNLAAIHTFQHICSVYYNKGCGWWYAPHFILSTHHIQRSTGCEVILHFYFLWLFISLYWELSFFIPPSQPNLLTVSRCALCSHAVSLRNTVSISCVIQFNLLH